MNLHLGYAALFQSPIHKIWLYLDQPLNQVIREFETLAETVRKNVEVAKSQGALDRRISDFGRLSDVVGASAAAGGPLARQNASILGHNSVAGSLTGGVASFGTSVDTPFLSSLGRILSGVPGTSSFGSFGLAANQAQQSLPGILGQAIQGGALGAKSIPSQVESGLRGQLGGGADANAIISAVVSKLQATKSEDIVNKGKVDVGAFSQELLHGAIGPFRDTFARLARELESAGQQLVDGMANVSRIASETGRQTDALSSIRGAALRNRAEDFATSVGQRGGGLNFLSVKDIQAPLQSQQERLTGLRGDRANNPELLGAGLRRVQSLIPVAQQNVERSVGSPDNLAAVSALSALQNRAGDLAHALSNLANVSERNAAIQEKLNAIDQDRQSRLSLAEQIATGDPASINRLNRGGALAQQAQFTGLGGINQPDRKILFDFLNSAGESRLGGVRGAPSAKQFKEQLLGSALPGIATPLGAGQEDALKDARAKNFDIAGRAQQQVIDGLKSQNSLFLDGLKRQADDFFSRLGTALAPRGGGAVGAAGPGPGQAIPLPLPPGIPNDNFPAGMRRPNQIHGFFPLGGAALLGNAGAAQAEQQALPLPQGIPNGQFPIGMVPPQAANRIEFNPLGAGAGLFGRPRRPTRQQRRDNAIIGGDGGIVFAPGGPRGGVRGGFTDDTGNLAHIDGPVEGTPVADFIAAKRAQQGEGDSLSGWRAERASRPTQKGEFQQWKEAKEAAGPQDDEISAWRKSKGQADTREGHDNPLATAMNNFPREVEMTGTHTHEHNFTGLEGFKDLEPTIQAIAQKAVTDTMRRSMPDAPLGDAAA